SLLGVEGDDPDAGIGTFAEQGADPLDDGVGLGAVDPKCGPVPSLPLALNPVEANGSYTVSLRRRREAGEAALVVVPIGEGDEGFVLRTVVPGQQQPLQAG